MNQTVQAKDLQKLSKEVSTRPYFVKTAYYNRLKMLDYKMFDLEADWQSIRPFDCVRGNCDYFSDLPERRIINTPYGVLLMQHRPEPPLNIIKEYKVKIFIYGHTHRRKFEEKNGIVYINPGAISFSRDGKELSYSIVEITPEKVNVKFYSLLD